MDDFAEMRCERCGKFMSPNQPGSSWACLFDYYPPGLREKVQRCRACTEESGPVRTNARGYVDYYEGIRAPTKEQDQ